MIELEMDFSYGNLSIELDLWSRKENKFRNTTAIFDTGANITHIDVGVLERLGYDVANADKSYVSTIGSRNMRINNMVLDDIRIGGLELGSVLANFSDMSDINSSIIIGLNIIKEFNINLDFENKVILMKPNFDPNNKIGIENFNKNNSRFGIWTITKQIESLNMDIEIKTLNIARKAEQKGEYNKAIEIAAKLLLKNTPIDEIIELTGLTEKKIVDIQKTLNR